ncbi:MAG: tetratricopeptide repeat protein, partial [Deltaproteobacteria bacterium]|nr:tetratricopeptide repeat protein [Deltaproteobacteria bacterium]
MKTIRGAAGLLLLFATARAMGAPSAGPSGFADWIGRGDPVAAEARFRADAARDPSDPWPLLGQAMLAERSLDEEAEVAAMLALVAAAPRHPLAIVALRRIGEVGLSSSLLAERADGAVGSTLDSGRLAGLAAYRARVVRAAVAEAHGDLLESARLRGQNGVATTWSMAGPFGALHALDMTRPFAPEAGPWLPRWELPGRAPLVSRTLPAPEGAVSLDGETPLGDVWYLASDLRLSRGGRYLLALGTTASARLFVDGAPMAERLAWSGWPSIVQVVPVDLGAGAHRVLVKLTRGGARPTLAVALARDDGAPADAEWKPAAGPGPAVVAGRPPAPVQSARALADALEPEGGAALARLVSARDRIDNDRQVAVVLLDEAVALAPLAGVVRSARGEAIAGDATQAERTARARAEADWREASRMDPGDAATRLVLVEVAMSGGRLDDAEALLSGLTEKAAARPRARLARARLLAARSFPEAAEGVVLEASRAGNCAAAGMLSEMASRRDAVALEDEAAEAMGRCPGGRERLADHRRTRGDLPSAAAIWTELVRAAPSRIDARMALARILVAQGDPAAAAGEVEELSLTWPSDPRIQRRLGELLELSGQRSAARSARQRALALDGADLLLRRGLALEDGREVLSDLAADGPATIREYEAAAVPVTTPASLVLDAAAVEAHADGSTTERTHQIVHVHDARGVEKWGEVEVPAGAILLQLKTRKRDGRVLEPEEHGGDKRTLSAAGREPGAYREVEWMRSHPARGPAVPGWVTDPFFFRGEELPFFRSTYAVAAPAGDLQLDVKHMASPKVVRQGDRDVMRAEARRVSALVGEPSAPGIAEYVPMIQAGWGDGIDGAAL